MIYLDTHIVVWLYAGEVDLFPGGIRELIEQNEVVISPIVLLELQYLKEIGRIEVESGVIFENLSSTISLTTCHIPFARIISESVTQSWTRDPFDRIIVANAIAQDSLLITKDDTILKNYPKAVWQ